jgi:lipopolysaccharide cholinephosphotransferase
MGIKEILKPVFSIDTKSTNKIIINFFGIVIRHSKNKIKEGGQKFYELDCPVTEIPKATGLLRKVQLANLKILIIFDKLCKDNNLNYWIDYGNLLGAMRHKGFIPWDDDMDISMLREDYEKFIELFKNGIPENPDLHLEFNCNGKNKCLLKIKHKKLGSIALDIFPYDFYYKKTNSDEKLKLTQKFQKIAHNPFTKLLYPFYMNRPEKLRQHLFKLRDKNLLDGNPVNKEEKPTVFAGLDFPHKQNVFYDYEDLFPLTTITYEGFEFPCPREADKKLSLVYGKYMELPQNCYPHHIDPEGYEGDMLTELENFIKDIS